MWICDSLLTVTTINNMGFIENNVVENKKKCKMLSLVFDRNSTYLKT